MDKPKIKTQREIYNEQLETLNGNPNGGLSFNRSNEISRKGDKVKDFKIDLLNIDETIFNHINNKINPTIVYQQKNIKVPLVWANSELWKSYRRDGWYRDKNGEMMLPIMAIMQTSVEKNRNVYNKLDANNPNLYAHFQTTYTKNQPYSNFDLLNNRKPTQRVYKTVVPDFVDIEYQGVVQFYTTSGINKVIEALQYASDSYWGEDEGFKFYVTIDSFKPITEGDAASRKSQATFNMKVKGYIIPQNYQKDMNSKPIHNTRSKIKIISESEE